MTRAFRGVSALGLLSQCPRRGVCWGSCWLYRRCLRRRAYWGSGWQLRRCPRRKGVLGVMLAGSSEPSSEGGLGVVLAVSSEPSSEGVSATTPSTSTAPSTREAAARCDASATSAAGAIRSAITEVGERKLTSGAKAVGRAIATWPSSPELTAHSAASATEAAWRMSTRRRRRSVRSFSACASASAPRPLWAILSLPMAWRRSLPNCCAASFSFSWTSLSNSARRMRKSWRVFRLLSNVLLFPQMGSEWGRVLCLSFLPFLA